MPEQEREIPRSILGIPIPPEKRYEITFFAQSQIEELSGRLARAEAIRFFETDYVTIDGLLIGVYPNPKVFAQTLLQMAYLEGGREELAKVYEAVENRGIDIRHGDLLPPFPIAAVATPELWPPPFPYGTLVKLNVLRDYLRTENYYYKYPSDFERDGSGWAESIYQHELFHILQAARNSIYQKAINAACNIFLAKVILSLPFVAQLPVGGPMLAYLKPVELEAYTKTAGFGTRSLTADPSFNPLRGKMFSFKRC